MLPATAAVVARYLADNAYTVSINTHRLRLAALSRWHTDHGFPDPTKAKVTLQVLKGIRAAHAVPERQAKPIELLQLQQVSDWLASSPQSNRQTEQIHQLRCARDYAMLLLGFWRGFRSSELVGLRVEHITVEPGVGMSIYLPQSKGDRDFEGRYFKCPALSRLCPVAAYEAWLAVSGITEGPVFRQINQWGHLRAEAMAAGSIVPWLRRLFLDANVDAAQTYTSHSLRRGFASWARATGWDLKAMMEYVGWKDVGSAMRYLDLSNTDLQSQFESGLTAIPESALPTKPATRRRPSPAPSSGERSYLKVVK